MVDVRREVGKWLRHSGVLPAAKQPRETMNNSNNLYLKLAKIAALLAVAALAFLMAANTVAGA